MPVEHGLIRPSDPLAATFEDSTRSTAGESLEKKPRGKVHTFKFQGKDFGIELPMVIKRTVDAVVTDDVFLLHASDQATLIAKLPVKVLSTRSDRLYPFDSTKDDLHW